MRSKIFRKVIIYSNLLFLGNIFTVFFLQFFAVIMDINNTLIQLPFDALFAFYAGYCGVRSLSKLPGVNKVLGSPFWQGVSIALFPGLLAIIITSFLINPIDILPGLVIILMGGLGGKRAASRGYEPPSRLEVLIFLTIVLSVTVGIFLLSPTSHFD